MKHLLTDAYIQKELLLEKSVFSSTFGRKSKANLVITMSELFPLAGSTLWLGTL